MMDRRTMIDEFRMAGMSEERAAEEADFSEKQQRTIDALVSALGRVRSRVSGNSVGIDAIKQIDAALALARGEG